MVVHSSPSPLPLPASPGRRSHNVYVHFFFFIPVLYAVCTITLFADLVGATGVSKGRYGMRHLGCQHQRSRTLRIPHTAKVPSFQYCTKYTLDSKELIICFSFGARLSRRPRDIEMRTKSASRYRFANSLFTDCLVSLSLSPLGTPPSLLRSTRDTTDS